MLVNRPGPKDERDGVLFKTLSHVCHIYCFTWLLWKSYLSVIVGSCLYLLVNSMLQ